MLSKSQISFVKSLHQKKFRHLHGLFLVEGIKSIREFLNSEFKFHSIYYTSAQQQALGNVPKNINLFEVTEAELAKISSLQQPQGILALLHIPENTSPQPQLQGYALVLDQLQDPGNLGTIIRTADWFGITRLICSMDTVEAYNPKTVQASMGSLARVQVSYVDLERYLGAYKGAIYAADLEGSSIYAMQWAESGLLVLGNEGQGLSAGVKRLVKQKVTIPQFGGGESLNVAISAAIFCAELKRFS